VSVNPASINPSIHPPVRRHRLAVPFLQFPFSFIKAAASIRYADVRVYTPLLDVRQCCCSLQVFINGSCGLQAVTYRYCANSPLARIGHARQVPAWLAQMPYKQSQLPGKAGRINKFTAVKWDIEN
jgi:hypothetical protein